MNQKHKFIENVCVIYCEQPRDVKLPLNTALVYAQLQERLRSCFLKLYDEGQAISEEIKYT